MTPFGPVDLGSILVFRIDPVARSSRNGESKLIIQWFLCQEPGVIGLALGLVCPVSVDCERVRNKV